MEKVLNRGLNFCILPLNLDITQVLVNHRQFERSMVWKEFWFGTEKDEKTIPIFKIKKTNFPRNHQIPKNLKICLSSIKSEIMDPYNRNKAEPNLPKHEFQAIKELIRLQRDRIITIKMCDKGAGIIVTNFTDYIEASMKHINSKQNDKKSYYKEVDEISVENAIKEINVVLDEAYDNNTITKQELNAMNPDGKNASKFYANFKVHKEHINGNLPEIRPIISGCGSYLENVSLYVEHFIKDLATKHASKLKDTPDFLRKLEEVKSKGALPKDAILLVTDVSALFTNIPKNEGIEATKEALNQRTNPEISTEFITRLLELILKHNIFEFNQKLYKQLIGSAMGSRPIPPYADIFMSRKVDPHFSKIAQKHGNLLFFKRFLDDLFSIFVGSTKRLHDFMAELNEIHPTIKFTFKHTTPESESMDDNCGCEPTKSVPFLDTLCFIENETIETDLYRKPSDRNKYLLPDSCHANSCKDNIPYSLFLRITRICSNNETKEIRFQELKHMLLDRNYPVKMIEAAQEKSRKIKRDQALKEHMAKPTTTRRPVFVVTWDPRLPNIQAITHRHWRTMRLTDPYLQEVYQEPPLIAYRRQKNIKDFLVRAKVPPPLKRNPQRIIPGMKQCHKLTGMRQCHTCPFVKEGKEITTEKFKWKINKSVSCEDKNVVYLIECNKERCRMQYVGETERSLRERFEEHKTYVNENKYQKTTERPGHTVSNMTISRLDNVEVNYTLYRQEG